MVPNCLRLTHDHTGRAGVGEVGVERLAWRVGRGGRWISRVRLGKKGLAEAKVGFVDKNERIEKVTTVSEAGL